MVFIKYSLKLNPDYLILEVGLGGRLDATNLFDCDIAALVSVSRDHQEFLGNSLKEILLEKIRIGRKGKLFLSSVDSNFLISIEKQYSLNEGLYYYNLFDSQLISRKENFHDRNAKLVKLILSELGFKRNFSESFNHIHRNINLNVDGQELLFSGSHNPHGLNNFLKRRCVNSSLNCDGMIVSFSKRNEKDLIQMMNSILAYSSKKSRIFITGFNHFKALDNNYLSKLINMFNDERLELISNWEEGISILKDEQKKKILFTGSYYFIGSILHDLYIQNRIVPSSTPVKTF